MQPVSTSPNTSRRASPAGANAKNPNAWQSLLLGGLLFYALAFGVALLAGLIRPERAFLLMAAPCLLPLGYYARDYFSTPDERDSGVMLSMLGWLLIALAFIFKQIAVSQAEAIAHAGAVSQAGAIAALEASSAPVPVCATVGVLCLLLGGVFSWLFWASGEEVAPPPRSDHYRS